MIKKMGYRSRLRQKMAEVGMFQTTDLVPLLAERGITLSQEQVFRLVTQPPQRLSLDTLAALCDILDCTPGDSSSCQHPGPQDRRRRARRCGDDAARRAAGHHPPPEGNVMPQGSRRLRSDPVDAAADLVEDAVATLGVGDARAVVAEATGSPRALRELHAHLMAHPDALSSGGSDGPRPPAYPVTRCPLDA